MNVIKKSKIKNGKIVLHGEVHGPAVATGTTVTSANSGATGGNIVKFPCIPEINTIVPILHRCSILLIRIYCHAYTVLLDSRD